MKTFKDHCGQLILCAWMLLGLCACDTEKNLENPDLHYFVKYYGSDGNQQGVDMLALSDGSFLLLGNYFPNEFESDIYLVRVDSEGNVIWERRFDGKDNSIAKDLEPTADGNFVVLSEFRSADSLTNLNLLKVSGDGNQIARVSFGTPANDYGRTVTLVNDGGFIVSGTTEFTSTYNLVNNPDPDLGDFFNYRFGPGLNQFSPNDWSPVFPGFGGKLDVAVKAIQRSNEFYVFGYSNINLSNTNPDKRLGLFYFKRNSVGGETDPYFPGNVAGVNDTKIFFATAVASGLGTGFIVIGTAERSVGFSEIFIARLRSPLTSNLQNDATLYTTIPLGRTLRGVAAASSVVGNQPGYLVLGNEVRSTENIWLSKIDQSGGILWSATFGSEAEEDRAAAVMELPDGKIVILGTMGLADNQLKMALIKVNPNGQLLN
ncbi:MAG: hypothetical protein WA874_01510 [Chryseosolibacter sp.]